MLGAASLDRVEEYRGRVGLRVETTVPLRVVEFLHISPGRGFPTLTPHRLSQVIFSFLFLLSPDQVPVRGSYTIARGSVVRGFDVTINLPSDKMVPSCDHRPICMELRHTMPSRAFWDRTCRGGVSPYELRLGVGR